MLISGEVYYNNIYHNIIGTRLWLFNNILFYFFQQFSVLVPNDEYNILYNIDTLLFFELISFFYFFVWWHNNITLNPALSNMNTFYKNEFFFRNFFTIFEATSRENYIFYSFYIIIVIYCVWKMPSGFYWEMYKSG